MSLRYVQYVAHINTSITQQFGQTIINVFTLRALACTDIRTYVHLLCQYLTCGVAYIQHIHFILYTAGGPDQMHLINLPTSYVPCTYIYIYVLVLIVQCGSGQTPKTELL